MSKIVFLVAVTASLISILATTMIAATVEKPMLKPSDFAIMPWDDVPDDMAALKDIRDCGFNLAGFAHAEDLDTISKVGLQCLVYSEVSDAGARLDQAEIDRRVEALVKRVGNHGAVFGYSLRDEPAGDVFPGLAKWVAAYKKAAPNALTYIDLLPNYAPVDWYGAPTYDGYVELFVKTVHPQFLCYDHYPLIDDGTVRDGYYRNLESMRKASLEHNLPFWNTVLSCAHFNYAEPTPAGFRFQAYTTMAYGARGISYFTYFARERGNYRLSPIDQFGHKTPTWDMLRDVNLQIHRLGPTYIALKSINVFHHPEVPSGCSGIATSKLLASVTGGNLLIGEFEGPKGQPFVMVVNKDLHKSTAFGLKFKEEGQIQKVNQYAGGIGAWGGEDCWLAPGQGALLCLKK
jgi:hypothetical protein